MLVDDEPNICHAVKRLLRADGYQIQISHSAEEAYALCQEHDFDLVITDQCMAEMRGAQLLSRIKDLKPLAGRLLMSGRSDPALVEQVLRAGDAHQFLAKPWNDQVLRKEVQNILDQKRLREENSLFAQVIDSSLDVHLLLNRHGEVSLCNQHFYEVTGYTANDVFGRALMSLFEFNEIWDEILMECQRQGKWSGEIEGPSHNGVVQSFEVSIEPVKPSVSEHYAFCVCLKDIKEQRWWEAVGHYHYYFDQVTGLDAVPMLKQRMLSLRENLRGKTNNWCLFAIHFHELSKVRFAYGQKMSELVIANVAAHLKSILKQDYAIAINHNDQLLVLPLFQTSEKKELRHCRKLLRRLRSPIELEKQSFMMSFSIGIGWWPINEDIDLLLDDAISSFSVLESASVGVHRCEVASRQLARSQLQIQRWLHDMVSYNRLQFTYQLQLDVDKNEYCGCESQLHWMHPVLGLLTEGEFVGSASSPDFVELLNRKTLETLVLDLENKNLENKSCESNICPCSIELFDPFLCDFNVPADLEFLQTCIGFKPEVIEIILHEKSLSAWNGNRSAALDKLFGTGVRVALKIDCMSASILGYMNDWPFSRLVLGEAWHREGNLNDGLQLLLLRMADLARNHGLTVLVQGVDTSAQYDFYRQLGVVQLQGKWISLSSTI